MFGRFCSRSCAIDQRFSPLGGGRRKPLISNYCAVSHSATPPWLEQVPEWCCDLE
jgi:hypothetical protein